jgi:hypothetical protein
MLKMSRRRVDVVGDTPVATLVYQRRVHQIALSEMPVSVAGGSIEPHVQVRDGFSLLQWKRLDASSQPCPICRRPNWTPSGPDFRRAAAAEREEPPKQP